LALNPNLRRLIGNIRTKVTDSQGRPVEGAVAVISYEDGKRLQSVAMPAANRAGSAMRKMPRDDFDALRKTYKPPPAVAVNGRTLRVIGSDRAGESERLLAITIVVEVPAPERPVRSTIRDQNGKPVRNAVAVLSYLDRRKKTELKMPPTDPGGGAKASIAQGGFEALRKTYNGTAITLDGKSLRVVNSQITANGDDRFVAEHSVHIPEPELEVRSSVADQNGRPVANAAVTLPYLEGNRTRTRVLPPTGADGSVSIKLPQSQFEMLRKGYQPPPLVKQGSAVLELTKSTWPTNNARLLVFDHRVMIPEPERPTEPTVEMRAVRILVVDETGSGIGQALVSIDYGHANGAEPLDIGMTGASGTAAAEIPDQLFQEVRSGEFDNVIVTIDGNSAAISRKTVTANSFRNLEIAVAVAVAVTVQTDTETDNPPPANQTDSTDPTNPDGEIDPGVPDVDPTDRDHESDPATETETETETDNTAPPTEQTQHQEPTMEAPMNPSKEELFRFLAIRQPEKIKRHRIVTKIVRDLRPNGKGSLHSALFAAVEYEDRLAAADAFLASPAYVAPDAPQIYGTDIAADFLRSELAPGVSLDELQEKFNDAYPTAKAVFSEAAPEEVAKELAELNGRLWDTFYALTVKGFDTFISTNYIADAIRVIHMMRLIWIERNANQTEWRGHEFDEYELLISPISREGTSAGDSSHTWQGVDSKLVEERAQLNREMQDLRRFETVLSNERNARGTRIGRHAKGRQPVSDSAKEKLSGLAAPKDFSAEYATGQDYQTLIDERRASIRTQLRQIRDQIANGYSAATPKKEGHQENGAVTVSAASQPVPLPGFFAGETLHVELDVGRIRPPMVGDMILVEQELLGYQMGELANIENVLKGERREHMTRDLSRNTETSSSTRETETSETESLKTDERFQLSNQATKSAENSFSADVGVSVSAKYGPVSIAVDANASYSQSRSTSQSQSQEFSRQITEEAAKSVRNLIKESSSITILSEFEKTTRHGFNNEGGDVHIAGLYRWVDKLYAARSVNYGRRLMITFDVPEPAAMLHKAFEEAEDQAFEGLEEPLPPQEYYFYDRVGEVRPVSGTSSVNLDTVYKDHTRLTRENYAAIAALYGVVDISVPPPDKITRSKAIAYPVAGEATDVPDHTDQSNELSYVAADNNLKVDPAYAIKRIGVWGTKGDSGGFGWYADTLLMATRNNKENTVLVLVGNKSFYFNAKKDGSNARQVSTNFNKAVSVDENELYAESIVDVLPITIQADFEGLLTFNVIYTATLRPEAFEEWQIATWAAIVKGYQRKKQEFEQSARVAEQKAKSETDETTHVLRDSQYRSIEQTELKRACIDILTEGTAIGESVVIYDRYQTPTYPTTNNIYGTSMRTPLTNGVIAAFFEESFEWSQMTYNFFPYYWTGRSQWHAFRAMSSPDPTFESFLTSGQAGVTVSVKPGCERAVLMFLRMGRVWTGGYLGLFDNLDMLTVYDDVEEGVQFDPPLQIGDPWTVRVPTSLIKLQEDSVLPNFETSFALEEGGASTDGAPVIDEETELPF
jgi:hypothetical protein